MPPFSELVLKDFQSHQFSVFNFHPNLNALVGPSNNGKSSVGRAIDFLTTGAWSKSYVRNGAKDSSISVRFEDGSSVSRIKGSGNKAVKIDSNGGHEEYSGFGEVLPTDLIAALGTPEFRIDHDKSIFANLARQHDPPFLLKEVGSLRAKILGRLSGLHLIDIAIRNLSNDSRNAQQRLGLERSRIDAAKKELEKYANLASDREQLAKLKAEVDKQQDLRQKTERISILLREIESFNSDVKSNKAKREKLASYDREAIKSDFAKKLVDLGVCPTCKTKFTEESAKFCLDSDHV